MQTNPLSDGSSRKKKKERRPKVSFARDIRPLFRAVDISHMKAHGIKLDDYVFMSDPDNADKVLGTLSPNEGDPPAMPPGGPHLGRGPARLVRPVAEGRIPAVSLIMATEGIPVSGYASKLLNRAGAAGGTMIRKRRSS